VKKVSIIVPVYNEEKQISTCVESLLSVDYPKSLYEIIVVLDGCTDSTYEVLKKFETKIKIIVLEKNHGPSEARNIGAKKSKGEIILFTDSDCTADKNWIKETVRAFKMINIECIAGKTNNNFKCDTFFEKYLYTSKSILFDFHFYKDDKIDVIDKAMPACNLSFKKDIFLKIGGFKKEYLFGEDDEICIRLLDSGYHIGYAPNALVINSCNKHISSFNYFLKKRIKYGIGWAWIAMNYPKKMRKSKLVLGSIFNLCYHTAFWLSHSIEKKELSILGFSVLNFIEDILSLVGIIIEYSRIGFKSGKFLK